MASFAIDLLVVEIKSIFFNKNGEWQIPTISKVSGLCWWQPNLLNPSIWKQRNSIPFKEVLLRMKKMSKLLISNIKNFNFHKSSVGHRPWCKSSALPDHFPFLSSFFFLYWRYCVPTMCPALFQVPRNRFSYNMSFGRNKLLPTYENTATELGKNEG